MFFIGDEIFMNSSDFAGLWCPVISDELFHHHSFLEFYTFDGGGGFINRELLGSVDSREITRLIQKEHKLDPFGELPKLDFRKFERWRTIEKSCWINRCYFLPALAQTAWLETDRELAETVKQVILHFLAVCPPPDPIMEHWFRVRHRMEYDYNRKTYEEFRLDETDVEYVWYDFQVASRLINFLHALYFIKNLARFTPSEKQQITQGLLVHGKVIYEQETHLEYEPGNHQSLRQTALLHAAAMNPDAAEAEKWTDFALERAVRHILEDFNLDGSLKEYAPSYHAFETWHGRDALALASRLGRTVPQEAVERIRKAGNVLNAYRRPDGRTLAINDAYPLAPDALLKSLGINPSEFPRQTLLKDGGLAVFHGKKLYAALDWSRYIGKFSHYHAGKNALIVYLDGQPVMDDPGCCSYDNPRFRACKQGNVHSSLLVDDLPDAHSFSIYGFDHWPEIVCDDWNGDRISAVLTSNRPEWRGVRWTRSLAPGDTSLTINDTVSAETVHDYTFLFALAPGVRAELCSSNEVKLLANGVNCWLAFEGDCSIVLEAAVGFQENPSRETLKIAVKLKKRTDCRLTTVLNCI